MDELSFLENEESLQSQELWDLVEIGFADPNEGHTQRLQRNARNV